MTDDALRDRAVHRLKAKRNFWTTLFTWIGLSIFFVVIWLFTGGPTTFFWPIWPIAGIALGVIGTAVSAFGSGSDGPSEAQIQSEMRKLDG